jgi:hypothetical protein
MTDMQTLEKTPDFYCEKCAFKCSKQSEWSRHVSTRKHQKNGKYLQKAPQHICACGKQYKHRQSLFNHKMKCSFINTTPLICEPSKPESLVTNEMVLGLIEQNKELQKQLVELSKQTHVINNTTNNTTNNNTQNNQFNLNVFLNENCKHAINIVDFVESLKITVNDLEQTGRLGYSEGITRIFIDALKRLDVTMRPLHCTDIKRETVYIKDQDNWEKENAEKTKLRNIVKKIARKNLKMLPAWQEQNPDFRYLDTPENNEFIQISLNSLGPESREEQENAENKIIRNVLKEVVIDKSRKIIENL